VAVYCPKSISHFKLAIPVEFLYIYIESKPQ
jgi:hypothetical protein